MEQHELNLSKIPAPLLLWYGQNARALPWRESSDPYRVWVSEIMLQQTRVEAVRAYYSRFLAAFGDIGALAGADDERLLKLWQGLGYYSRAKNLKKAAQMVMENFGGQFPRRYEDIRRLPGIGDYTAGAISSICFGAKRAAVDGNVLRVYTRLAADFSDISSPAFKKEVATRLEAVMPQNACGDFNQALMELGATVCCANSAPKCEACPLAGLCRARALGVTSRLPVKPEKKARKVEPVTVLVLVCQGRLAIKKRPAKGLLANLWELPNGPGELSAKQAEEVCAAWGAVPQSVSPLGPARHVFTHIVWEMQGFCIICGEMPPDFVWASPEELQKQYSLPSAFRPYLESFLATAKK